MYVQSHTYTLPSLSLHTYVCSHHLVSPLLNSLNKTVTLLCTMYSDYN